MAHRPRRVIDRRAIGRITGMEFRARAPVEGFYSGIHKSPYHGFNVEFSQYREYSPGDDLRFLDWRVYARSDRFFLKQFEAETNLNCYLMLDCSRSMEFTTADMTRLDYGASLAAALTLLMLRQGDQVGLCCFDDQVRRFIPPRGNARHFGAVVEALENADYGEDSDIASALHTVAERARRRSLVIVISDFFDDVEAMLNGLQHFRSRRHEVVAFHLLDDAEFDFPFERITLFEGMERGEETLVDPQVLSEGYRRRFRSYLDTFRRGCTEKNVDHQVMRLSKPFDKALSSYLSRRR